MKTLLISFLLLTGLTTNAEQPGFCFNEAAAAARDAVVAELATPANNPAGRRVTAYIYGVSGGSGFVSSSINELGADATPFEARGAGFIGGYGQGGQQRDVTVKIYTRYKTCEILKVEVKITGGGVLE